MWLLGGAAAIGVVAWLAFAPLRASFFRHDDFGWLRVAQRWEDTGGLSRAITQGHAGFTLVYNLIYCACYRLAPLDPRPHWDCLIAAHAVNSLLVVALVWLISECELAALTSGLVFALLFSHHEAVGWLGGGLHVYALVFMLASLVSWAWWRKGGWAGFLPLALLLGTLALLTKASAVPLVLLVALVDYALGIGLRWRSLAWWLIPYAVMVALRLLWPPSHYVVSPEQHVYGLGPHALANLALCPPQMLVPDLRFSNYALLVQRLLPAGLAALVIRGSVGVILALSALALILAAQGDRVVRVGVAWAYLAFLPEALFRYDYAIAPRYLYIPSVGLALLAGYAFARWAERRQVFGPRLSRACVGLVLIVAAYNLPPLMVMEQHRLRDSHVRRQAVQSAAAVVQSMPVPVRTVFLTGLPEPLHDVALGLQVFSHTSFQTRWVKTLPKRLGPGELGLRFRPDGSLVQVVRGGWQHELPAPALSTLPTTIPPRQPFLRPPRAPAQASLLPASPRSRFTSA